MKKSVFESNREKGTNGTRHGPIHHLCWLELFLANYMIGREFEAINHNHILVYL